MSTTARLHRSFLVAAVVAAGLLMGTTVQAQDAPASVAAPAIAGPVILMVQMHVKPDREQDFLKLLAKMKARVKSQDHGNIRYELFAVAPAANAAAASAPASNYVFLEEWRDQAAAAAHGKWAGPIVRTQWREMTDSMQVSRLSRATGH